MKRIHYRFYGGLTGYVHVFVVYSYFCVYLTKSQDMEFHFRLRSTEAMFIVQNTDCEQQRF